MIGNLRTIIEHEELTPRGHGRVTRQMLRERMRWHGLERIPKHFLRNRWTTPGGTYRYATRSKSWREIKKRFGVDPDRPNWWSGWLFGRVMQTAKVRATQNQGTWTATGAGNVGYPTKLKLRFGRPHPMRDEQRREIETVSKDERESDARWYEKRYVQLARRPEFRRKRKSRIG